jgi:hypothetical protein
MAALSAHARYPIAITVFTRLFKLQRRELPPQVFRQRVGGDSAGLRRRQSQYRGHKRVRFTATPLSLVVDMTSAVKHGDAGIEHTVSGRSTRSLTTLRYTPGTRRIEDARS